jgi:hypothetical protein
MGYTVLYYAYLDQMSDARCFWDARKVGPFDSRAAAEQALLTLARHDRFREGKITCDTTGE